MCTLSIDTFCQEMHRVWLEFLYTQTTRDMDHTYIGLQIIVISYRKLEIVQLLIPRFDLTSVIKYVYE